jgi:hypothetical protein
MEDIEDPLEEDLEDPLDDEDVDDVADVVEPDTTAARPEAGVESIEALIAKKDGQRPQDDDEDPLMSLGREERLEPLAVKVIPAQATEFVCKKCYLVKHQSQLKDKKKMLCRDCA